MQPPKNASIHETSTSIAWLDESGIIYSVSKKAPEPTIEQTKKELVEFRKKFGEGKFCMLLDITNATASSKEVRDFAAEELNKMVKAIAMISGSAVGRMIANLFFGLKPPPYPAKMFAHEEEAKEWLMQYLK